MPMERRPMIGAASRMHAWRGAFAGALTTALVQMPFDAVYGTIAFAPLGPQFAPIAVASALIGTVVVHVVASLAGSRHMVLGPRPATTLLVAGLVAALLAQPSVRGADGAPIVPLVLALVALGLVAAGLMQVAFGALKLGNLTRYLPYPVRAGFMNGVGVLLVLGGLRLMLGMPPDGDPTDLVEIVEALRRTWPLGALAVGAVTMLGTLRPPHLGRIAPSGALFGILAGIILHQALALFLAPAQLGATMSAAGAPMIGAMLQVDWGHFAGAASLQGLVPLLLGFAMAVALLASLDTFLVTSIMDSVTRTRRDGNRELIAQGLSNIASALAGGQPSAPAPVRTLLNYHAGGHAQASIWLYAGLVAATLFLVPGLLTLIPMSALGGALIVVGCQMADGWTRRAPGQLLRQRGESALQPRERRTLRDNYAVMLLVAATVVVLGVAQGVLVGVIASMVLFVRNNSRALIRHVVHGDVRRSIKVRVSNAADALDSLGKRLALLELEGMLFFGTAGELADRVQQLAQRVDYVVLGMRRVNDIDSTGARALLDLAADLDRAGKVLLVADLREHDTRMQSIRAMGGRGPLAGMRFEVDVDTALQWVEDRLLEAAGIATASDRALALAETVLGRDLAAEDLDWLLSRMTEVHVAPGDYLFRYHDPGDALFVSIKGEMSIKLPGAGGKRLASMAPGVIVGEIALLEGGTRTADALAESALTVLRLERASFEGLRQQRPALWDKLMRNIALSLATRLHVVTIELAAVIEP
jgi:SulP family sulfate permease